MGNKSVTATVKLTKWLLDKVDELVDEGIFTSRSEALREAARLMVLSQYGSMGKRESIFLTDEEKSKALKKYAKEQGIEL